MRIETDIKLGFKDVLIKPKRSTLKSRAEVSLLRRFIFRHSQREWEGIPIIAANMDTVGTFSMVNSLAKQKLLTMVHKHYTLPQWQTFLQTCSPDVFPYLGISVGMLEKDEELLTILLRAYPTIQFICIDVANGYTERFVSFVSKIRSLYPDKVLIAGNVVTPEMVEELVLAGADIIKVGIGPGSVCTTRVKTGVGYPQLSAVIECADAAHGLGGLVISDGGCTCSGDIAKAFGAGADFVMLGGMLAGHAECEGTVDTIDGKKVMHFYGMSSEQAMKKHVGEVAHYRAAEGKMVQIPFRGAVEHTVLDLLGGVRSACTYVGASKLKELSKRTTFIRVQEQENQIFHG